MFTKSELGCFFCLFVCLKKQVSRQINDLSPQIVCMKSAGAIPEFIRWFSSSKCDCDDSTFPICAFLGFPLFQCAVFIIRSKGFFFPKRDDCKTL